MKNWFKKTAPYLMFAAAWVLILATFLLEERITERLSIVLFMLGGVLLGFGAVGIALSRIRMSPEQLKEYERGAGTQFEWGTEVEFAVIGKEIKVFEKKG